MDEVFLGVGSNLGDPMAQNRQAVNRLKEISGISVEQVSPWFLTEPLGARGQPWYVNGVLRLGCRLEPPDLLEICRNLEIRAGRMRTGRWEPRQLDLDILLWGNRIMVSTLLQIPHPRMHLRRFVLEPICAIAPDVRHPVFGTTMTDLLIHLADPLIARRLSDSDGESV